MTRTQLILTATAGSVALLGGAFVFQLLGYAPCKMCYWQRWPHAVAIFIGVLAITLSNRALAWLDALAAAITGSIGFYHSGVERDYWEGPSSCTGAGGGLEGLSADDLLSTDGPKVIMCDVVSWQLFGLSMPSWNALFSAILVVLWVLAARRA